MGCDMPRKESICERIAFPRSRTQSHQFGITSGTSSCKRRCILFYRVGAIQHWGNSCETTRDSDWSSVLYERNCIYEGSGRVFLLVHHSEGNLNRDLEIGHEISAPLWSRRATDGAVQWNTINSKLLRALETKEYESFQTMIGFNTFMKEVTRRASSTARISKIPWCMFVQFKDTLVRVW